MAAASFDFTGKRALVTGGGRGGSYKCVNERWKLACLHFCKRLIFCGRCSIRSHL